MYYNSWEQLRNNLEINVKGAGMAARRLVKDEDQSSDPQTRTDYL